MPQPPFPLQEFLPAQPLSPVLQPPLPLQPFLPAQSWVSPFFSSASTPALGVPVLAAVVAALSWAVRPPERRPAMAAPVRSALLVDCLFIWIIWMALCVWFWFWFVFDFAGVTSRRFAIPRPQIVGQAAVGWVPGSASASA